MSRNFETTVTTRTKARINSDNIGAIIEEEINRVLGGSDRFIDDIGIIKENDYRFNSSETIRQATKEEIELVDALYLVSKHFKEM